MIIPGFIFMISYVTYVSGKLISCLLQIFFNFPHQLAFEVTYPVIAGNEVTLDDIALSLEPCPSNVLSCNFEQDLCGWINDSPSVLLWLVGRGYTSNASLVSGPFSDHTTKNGFYAYVDFTHSYPG